MSLNAALENPASRIKKLSERAHERNRFLRPQEISVLIEAAKTTKAKNYLPALIYLGCEHGASKQEALSLRWSDIKFDYEDTGLISFHRTKTDNERTEYLMPNTRDALLHWQSHQASVRKRRGITPVDSDLVFSHFDGTPIKCFNKAWWAALKAASIQDFHFHDLRHTFCSNLLLAGGTLKDAKEMIGHKDVSMTDRYSHLTLEHKTSRQRQLAEYYSAQLDSLRE
nr:site-specific integrase [uncultured Desulfobulbus sp.]